MREEFKSNLINTPSETDAGRRGGCQYPDFLWGQDGGKINKILKR
jgi:hypothetical protein